MKLLVKVSDLKRAEFVCLEKFGRVGNRVDEVVKTKREGGYLQGDRQVVFNLLLMLK